MWKFQGKEFTQDDVCNHYAFVYEITNKINGRKYIGKKFFISMKTLPPLKGRKRKRKIKKPSDWMKYYGSSKVVAADIAKYGKENFEREIISLHPDKREANYRELCEQIIRNVLEAVDEKGNKIYYNENIDRIYYPCEKQRAARNTAHGKMILNALGLNTNSIE